MVARLVGKRIPRWEGGPETIIVQHIDGSGAGKKRIPSSSTMATHSYSNKEANLWVSGHLFPKGPNRGFGDVVH
jgi:hypothetical protein